MFWAGISSPPGWSHRTRGVHSPPLVARQPLDRADSGAGYKNLHTFGVPNETPFCEFSGELRAVVSAGTCAELVLALGAEIVLEVVRMAVNEQYSSLMPTLCPGVTATEMRAFGTLDAMWLAFQTLANNKTQAINGEICFICLLLSRVRGRPSPRPPGPLAIGVARVRRLPRVGRLPRRMCGRRDHAIVRLP